MSAGQMLSEARAARGMSLDDLAQIAKLRASILSAIEQDDFSHCGDSCTPAAAARHGPRPRAGSRGPRRGVQPRPGSAPSRLTTS